MKREVLVSEDLLVELITYANAYRACLYTTGGQSSLRLYEIDMTIKRATQAFVGTDERAQRALLGM